MWIIIVYLSFPKGIYVIMASIAPSGCYPVLLCLILAAVHYNRNLSQHRWEGGGGKLNMGIFTSKKQINYGTSFKKIFLEIIG